MEMSQITKIEDGFLYYEDGGIERKINLKTSADRYWELFHKQRFGDKLFRRKSKNRYVGVKEFGGISDLKYFKIYDEREKYCFQMMVTDDNREEAWKFFHDMNEKLRRQGYFLFDYA